MSSHDDEPAPGSEAGAGAKGRRINPARQASAATQKATEVAAQATQKATTRATRTVSRVGAQVERHDPYWQPQLAALGALLLYLTLPSKFTIGPDWLVPAAEGAMLLGLVATTPRQRAEPAPERRTLAIVLVALATVANLVALELLVRFLLRGGKAGGHELILAGIEIWLTNVLIFALWFWLLDRGGPEVRQRPEAPAPDFLFPQMTDPAVAPPGWRPNFMDYLYTSYTNATAFSPTDTMPLTAWAKGLMLVQSAASLVTVGLLVARAVNILS